MSTETQKHKALRNILSCAIITEAINVIEDEHKIFAMNRMSTIRRVACKNRIYRQRQKWSAFQAKLSDRQFRRYFRMERECFFLLCRKIEGIVGLDVFKSEEYLEDLNMDFTRSGKAKMFLAHSKSTGGFICGEIKIALSLRLLAGGSYLDLALLFETSFSYAYEIIHHVVRYWFNDNNLINISGRDFFNNEDALKESSEEFARRSDGIMWGTVGAIDGWLVKIKKPTVKGDGVSNPGLFYCRKGFHAINVQVLVDRKKRILYRSILCRGAEHDASAFKQSSLSKILQEKSNWLRAKGYFIIGDSAYALRSYLLTPYDRVSHGTAKDNFNFYHSSSRICVECAFGEIDMRFGILWKPLGFKLKNSIQVIDACLRLHNFILSYRESQNRVNGIDLLERSVFTEDTRRFISTNPDSYFGVYGGEDEVALDENGLVPTMRERIRNEEVTSRRCGIVIRDTISSDIERRNLMRPRMNWFRVDNRVVEN